MRRLSCWNDLEQFGIIALTGEACGLAMRLLCDVTKQGAEHLQRFLGGTVTIKPGSNWNGGSSSDPHVGSILLPRTLFLDLAAFLLLTTRTSYGVCKCQNGDVREFEGSEPPSHYFSERIWRRSSDPGTGDRNEHAMSGRVE